MKAGKFLGGGCIVSFEDFFAGRSIGFILANQADLHEFFQIDTSTACSDVEPWQ